jgi:2-polyprenyl-3-methyl-5-hydroxy-6-metoxy-1,4-benzoquinol methylase
MNVSTKHINNKLEYDSSYDYWNNEKLEKGKVFYYLSALQNSKDQQFFIDELSQYLDKNGKVINSFLNVCCGNLWVETNALKEKNIAKVVGIDYSQHRVHKLALKSIEHTKNDSNIELICGNVLDYKSDEKFDFIYLPKAFHHIESPIALLRKLKNLLSSNGKIIICGEHFYSSKIYIKCLLKHFIKFCLNSNYRIIRSFIPEYGMLFPYSLEKGDIHYSLYQYDYFF